MSSKPRKSDSGRKPPRKSGKADDLIPASSLMRAVNVVGDVWTVLILKEAFLQVHRFQELHERLQGASFGYFDWSTPDLDDLFGVPVEVDANAEGWAVRVS